MRKGRDITPAGRWRLPIANVAEQTFTNLCILALTLLRVLAPGRWGRLQHVDHTEIHHQKGQIQCLIHRKSGFEAGLPQVFPQLPLFIPIVENSIYARKKRKNGNKTHLGIG
jgi:hypothetical protein